MVNHRPVKSLVVIFPVSVSEHPAFAEPLRSYRAGVFDAITVQRDEITGHYAGLLQVGETYIGFIPLAVCYENEAS